MRTPLSSLLLILTLTSLTSLGQAKYQPPVFDLQIYEEKSTKGKSELGSKEVPAKSFFVASTLVPVTGGKSNEKVQPQNLIQSDQRMAGCLQELIPFIEGTLLKNPDVQTALLEANKKLKKMNNAAKVTFSLSYTRLLDGTISLLPRFFIAEDDGSYNIKEIVDNTSEVTPLPEDEHTKPTATIKIKKSDPRDCHSAELLKVTQELARRMSIVIDQMVAKENTEADEAFRRRKGKAMGPLIVDDIKKRH